MRTETPPSAGRTCVAILPPRSHSSRDMAALETTMHTLTLDRRHPVSLEIAGTAQERLFLLRATTPGALRHLAKQLQAQYPQAEVRDTADPLPIQVEEDVSVIELTAGAASYQTLRQWGPRDLKEEGADPLVGILAALTHLPAQVRVIAQLALVPATPAWSAADWRKTVEHPLEPERHKEQRQYQRARITRMDTPSLPVILGLIVLAALGLLWRARPAFLLRLAPWWEDLLHGKLSLTTPAIQVVFWGLVGGIVALSLGFRLVLHALGLGQSSIYDMRQVDEKTRRFAYHARLRLIAIGPRARRARTRHHLRTLAIHLRWGVRSVPARSLLRMYRLARAYRAASAHDRPDAVSARGRLWRGVRRLGRAGRLLRIWITWWVERRRAARLSRRSRLAPVRSLRQMRRLAQSVRPMPAQGDPEKGRLRRAARLFRIWSRWHRRRLATRLRQERRLARLARRERVRFTRAQRVLRQERQTQLQHLAAAYQQYHQAKGAFFRARSYLPWFARRVVRPGTGWLAWWQGWSQDVRRSRQLLSVAEVASLWHLPQTQDLADIPLLFKEMNRTLLVPQELAFNDGTGYRLGHSLHAGYDLPVYLPARALSANVLAVASTGKGKSTLFQHLAEARLASLHALQGSAQDHRMGLAIIEPHGDFLTTLAGRIPPSLADRVVLVDLADTAHPPGINPLDMALGRDRDKAVDNLLVTFKAIWSNSWGPRTENILEFALKTLAEVNERQVDMDPQQQYTLLDIVPLLRNASFRHGVLGLVRDETIKQWWEHYYELMHPNYQTEVISSVINKMSKYSSSRTARRILGQPLSTINLRQVIEQGQILLMSTASGIVGSDISSLIGATLLNLFQTSLAEQASIAPEERRRYFLIVDEFQTFLGADYQTMLAELRKYGGSFALATQSLAYLEKVSDTLRSTVLANVDQLFAFDMSGEDAKMMLPELDGVVEEVDITNLDNYTCYAKLSLDGRRLPLFSLHLDPPGVGDAAQAQYLRQQNQQHYGRPADRVDALLLQRLEALRAFEQAEQKNQDDGGFVKKRGTYGNGKGGPKKLIEPPLRDQAARILSVPLAREEEETWEGEERER